MAEQNTDPTFVDLKTARETLGFTLKDLFERTRISVANLEAMENGDFHLLPVPIYTRNFIKTYARALNVDSAVVLQRYENYLKAQQMKEQAQKNVQPKSSALGAIWRQYRVYVWIGFLVIVFASVSYLVSFLNKTDEKTQTAQASLPVVATPETTVKTELEGVLPLSPEGAVVIEPTGVSPVQPEGEVVGGLLPEREGKQDATTKKSNNKKAAVYAGGEEPSLITIQATEETWIRIQADDQESFQVLLKPGEKVSRQGARFLMDIGNAGGIKVRFNGKTFENLGRSGQVIHMRLP